MIPTKQIILNHLGNKWEPLGRGPNVFDCWGLYWYLNKTYNGREFPQELEVNVYSNFEKSFAMTKGLQNPKWIQTDSPVDFDLVAMSRKNAIHHVGCYFDIDGGIILHAYDFGNVVANNMQQLRNLGLRTIKFYHYNG